MPKITFLEASGTTTEVDAGEGLTLMEAATQNNIAGIVAACGGACSCATCLVTLPTDWWSKLAPPDEDEQMMIEFAPERQETSRLSCQIVLTAQHDGLVVEIPANQV